MNFHGLSFFFPYPICAICALFPTAAGKSGYNQDKRG